jgi:hypothetical protein
MAIEINGTGTITGISSGGLNDGIITQAELASGVAGNGPAFSAHGNITTSVANATSTKLICNVEYFDSNSCFDVVNSRFTPNVAGYYQVTANSQWSSASVGSLLFALKLYANGSQLVELNVVPYVNLYTRNIGSSLVYLNGTTDYLEIYAFQNSGVTADILATEFSASLVRAAS